MPILIKNNQNSLKIDIKKIRQKAKDILNASGFPDSELSILITDDMEMASLNKKYLHKEGSTNVIAFPMHQDISKAGEITGIQIGDVVISADTAKKESEIENVRFEAQLLRLLVHGILHLIGYDHETGEEDAAAMEAKSVELCKLIGC